MPINFKNSTCLEKFHLSHIFQNFLLILPIFYREQVEIEGDFSLQYGIQVLENEDFVVDCGIQDEGVISVHASLDGGKRKRKKKVHTTPKRIPHVHKKRPKALLEYFSVDDSSGKVKRLKQESPNAAGAYMADHPDRFTCGRTGTMFYKLTSDGKRLPIPKQVHKAKAEKAAVVKKVAKKKK